MLPDLLIVADPADELAAELGALARSSGYSVECVGADTACRYFSVEIGDRVAVSPDIPLLLRIPGPPVVRQSFGAAFLFGEQTGTLWAAGALMHSPCVNRPGFQGLAGRCSYASGSSLSRAGLRQADTEIFAREVPEVSAGNSWAIQSTTTQDTTMLPALPSGGGPYRVRTVPRHLSYDIVVVVGELTWRLSSEPRGHLALEARSVQILHSLGLTFGAVVWAVPRPGPGALVARIEAFPPFMYVQPIWDSAGRALLGILTSCSMP